MPANISLPPLVALAGYSGVGKDEAAKALLVLGYQRHNFADIIKRQCDPLVRQHFGFSAHTEVREQKDRIRRTLESWGEDNYDAILAEFLATIPARCVNTRICRAREATAWCERGGVIVLITRPGFGSHTVWERGQMTELEDTGLICATVANDGDLEQLRGKFLQRLHLICVAEGARQARRLAGCQ